MRHRPDMQKPRQARYVETRRRFVEAARELFGAHRYEEVTIRLIAERVGRAPSLIFIYWPDKASIWREVMGCEPPGDTSERRLEQAKLRQFELALPRLFELVDQIDAGLGRADLRATVIQILSLFDEDGGSEPAPLASLGAGRRNPPPQEDRPQSISNLDRSVDPQIVGANLAASIGARIRARRLALELPLSALSQVLNVSIQQISRYERGASRVPSAALVVIARELRCSPLELLCDDSSSFQNPAGAEDPNPTADSPC